MIGYGSKLAIENTGSLLIYQLLIAVQLLAAFTIVKKLKKLKKLRKWAKKKRKNFYWSGAIDF